MKQSVLGRIRFEGELKENSEASGHTAGLLDVLVESLGRQLAESSEHSAAGGRGGVLAGAAEGTDLSLGVDGNVGEGEEDVALLASLLQTQQRLEELISC